MYHFKGQYLMLNLGQQIMMTFFINNFFVETCIFVIQATQLNICLVIAKIVFWVADGVGSYF